MYFILNHLIKGGVVKREAVEFIKIRIDVISGFSDVYTGTTKFEHYIKTFDISVMLTVQNIKLYILNLFCKN